LIQSVYRSLSGIDKPEAAAAVQTPAVSVRRSVFPDFIVCLEDGKKLKMLKRHLQTSYGMTPDDYRTSGAYHGTTQWWRRTTRPSGPIWPSKSA
jgi:predicted transcriptional regulator